MKTIFLILFLVGSTTNYETVKLEVEKPNTVENYYCDQVFLQNVTWVETPGQRVWGVFVYQNKVVFAHYWLDHKGNYIL